jgi:hypothetical protein
LSASIINVEDDIYRTNRTQNLGADLPDGPPESGKNESQFLESVHDVLPPLPTHDAPDFEGYAISKGRSLGHPLYNNKQAYFISFDIKTGGEYVEILLGGPVGKSPPLFSRTHKSKQQKKPEKWDQSQTDHSTISAKCHFDASLLPALLRKEFDSFCKEITDSGNVMADAHGGRHRDVARISFIGTS